MRAELFSTQPGNWHVYSLFPNLADILPGRHAYVVESDSGGRGESHLGVLLANDGVKTVSKLCACNPGLLCSLFIGRY